MKERRGNGEDENFSFPSFIAINKINIILMTRDTARFRFGEIYYRSLGYKSL